METLSSCNEPATEGKDKKDFYDDAALYWSNIPPTVDGMLGGYGHISTVDINGSSQFLRQLFRLKSPPGKARALDCGAGIGRITKNLLFNHFRKVDLVEQNPAFVAQARVALETHQRMGNFFCSGLQDFTPEPATYDVIWCQWVLGHLTNDDLLAFLNGCILGLKVNGVIVLKENTTTNDQLDIDATDSSVTRPLHLLCELLQRAGLRCVKQKRQVNFPHGLYPVYMIATRPSLENIAASSSSELMPIDTASEGLPETPVKDGGGGDSNYDAEEMSEFINGKSESVSDTSLILGCSVGEIVSDIQSPSLQTSPIRPEPRDGFHSSSVLKAAVQPAALPSTCSSSDKVLTKSQIVSDGSCLEGYEQEATDFSHEVEYSSDDSTKTESSTADVNDPILIAPITELPICQNVTLGFRNSRQCDIA